MAFARFLFRGPGVVYVCIYVPQCLCQCVCVCLSVSLSESESLSRFSLSVFMCMVCVRVRVTRKSYLDTAHWHKH